MAINPYRPGAGRSPLYLAGREQVLSDARDSLEALGAGEAIRSTIYYGLRGVGKTVLLNYLENIADEYDILTEYMEVSEQESSFQQNIALHIYKLITRLSTATQLKSYAKKALGILKAFSLKYSTGGTTLSIDIDPLRGFADTGNLANDIKELLLALGNVAHAEGRGVAIFIDETQYLQEQEFSALCEGLHRINQKGYPLAIFAAGLPKIAKIAGDAKSYAERLFSFVEIGSLTDTAACDALAKPASKYQVSYTPEALKRIIAITQGYPYFLQEYGSCVWEAKGHNDTITLDIVNKAQHIFQHNLDKAFFKVRHDRATPRELEFMTAMIKCPELPCSTKQVADLMDEPINKISPLRAQLIHKGFIYAVDRGFIDFTVPQFDTFLRRMYGK